MGVQKLLAYWEVSMRILVRLSIVILLCSCLPSALGDYSDEEEYEYEEEEEEYDEYDEISGLSCEDGMFLPLWSYYGTLSTGERVGRGLLYICIFLYMVLGVGVYLNRMMESVETITSWMKKSSVPNPRTGKPQEIVVKIWNQSVANIFTVFISTSTILLFCLTEIWGKGFKAGDLGPFAIIGSSVFNLLISIGIAVSATPKGKARKVVNLGALILIVVLTFLLYSWIDIAVAQVSYGMVEIWEAVVTIIFFLVILISITMVTTLVGKKPKHDAAWTEYMENYKLYKRIIQKITTEHPSISDNVLLQKVLEFGVGRRPKSWAYYLTRATNMLAGSRVLENMEADMEKEEGDLKTVNEKAVDEIALASPTTEIMDNLKPKVDFVLLRGNSICICDCGLWLQQLRNLVNLQDLGRLGPFYLIIHFLSLPWKLLAAFISPASTLGGIVPFIMSWGSIFFLLPFIYDIAGHLGCFILCKDMLTGFLLVSITFNLPNLIAAKIAAAEEEDADLPLICLLTGNGLTASLGFGLPWFIASIYWESYGDVFHFNAWNLEFSTKLFLYIAPIAFVILFIRRCCAGGELGGSTVWNIITTIIFLLLWVLFTILISLEGYNIIF